MSTNTINEFTDKNTWRKVAFNQAKADNKRMAYEGRNMRRKCNGAFGRSPGKEYRDLCGFGTVGYVSENKKIDRKRKDTTSSTD